mmetsp:Transcript_5848/g.12317  ORF Transcript_5848/g.12317 Transcript_5848/m.12317 type:complete len:415 (-) Transcript_5848:210-1454(-)|eukprot:CAMPEP_0201120596 /NCGR_PEP_ID=MMETSP0850-20130426/4644_1 /ASSEMBLY_ACC=CAM_ASM_000622 /TAXON_ID=183588 /ORGANISM="Pseudo-nitzschia fraudulenta, Strain WWA7" /LENGTH=414 /DNA_ID=CAMNT_0047386795 /DNA_START=493 /DNA_END=1737 /DNA_ORIENTATION=+
MATAATKLSSQSPPFNPNRILAREQSQSPQPPTAYGSRSRSSSPFSGSSSNNNNNNPHRGILTPGGGGRRRIQYPSNPNSAHSNAIAKHTFEHNGETLEIRNVWAENVEEEMRVIRELVDKYPYVSMDTEFPGVVAKPVTEAYTSDYHYKSLKVNVDLLKIIQLGLSFSDEKGNLCKDCPCWQFNFAFDLDGDMFAQDSIDLLVNSGISFPDHATRGIDPQLFGELLMVSGLVLDDRVRWITYHAGYDFAYLLKILTTKELPSDEKGFFDLLKIYFPTVYDIKYMTSLCDGHRFMGGLQRLADDLGCQRLGAEHQAGSDSLLTKDAFFALVKARFVPHDSGSKAKKSSGGSGGKNNKASNSAIATATTSTNASGGWFDDTRFANELYGYGNNHTARKGPVHVRDVSSVSNSASE